MPKGNIVCLDGYTFIQDRIPGAQLQKEKNQSQVQQVMDVQLAKEPQQRHTLDLYTVPSM